jgi:hypothetical protein
MWLRHTFRLTTRNPRQLRFRSLLRSDIEPALFQAQFMIRWTPLTETGNHATAYLETIVRNHTYTNAGKLTGGWPLQQADAAQDAVNIDFRKLAGVTVHPGVRIDSAWVHLSASRRMRRMIRKEQDRLLPQATGKRAAQLAELADLRLLRDEILAYPDLGLVWWLRNRCEGPGTLSKEEFNNAVESVKSVLDAQALQSENPAEIVEKVLNGLGQDERTNFFRHMRGVLDIIDQSAAGERLEAALSKHNNPGHTPQTLLSENGKLRLNLLYELIVKSDCTYDAQKELCEKSAEQDQRLMVFEQVLKPRIQDSIPDLRVAQTF